MKTNRYLLPTYFKKIGWIISLPMMAILFYYLIGGEYKDPSTVWSFFENMFTDPSWRVLGLLAGGKFVLSVCMVSLIVGLLFISFSKEKIEDEFIAKMRGDSLIWAVIVNSFILIAAFILLYDGYFLYVAFLNLYTLLVLFVLKFNITLLQFKKSNSNEE